MTLETGKIGKNRPNWEINYIISTIFVSRSLKMILICPIVWKIVAADLEWADSHLNNCC